MAHESHGGRERLNPQHLNRDGSRPVQPVKVSYSISWLYFLMVICLLVAWYFPAKILITRMLWPPAIEEGVRDSYSFVALAYEGVSRKENELSPAQFREHLTALQANEYVPISLEDVRRLLVYNEPVPRNAVLLTFDHGRRTSYFGVKSHLRRAGWRGVMFLWTKPIEDRDPASLLWPYVRSMVRARSWEIGAQSHNGFTPVQANAAGRTGNYMTTPQWLEREERFETPDEFSTRIRADHEFCLDLIERRVGIRPSAYAYPYGDFGQFQARGTFMRRVNLAHVAQFYELGFVSGNLPVNTRYSDPRRLNRVRVRPEWNGTELVAYLDNAWPRSSPDIEGTAEEVASAWIVDWGQMYVEMNRMSLQATDQTTGAKMWLGGSDLARDFYARVEFRLYRGQMGLYLRASPDEESYIYLGIDSRGEAWLREKRSGMDQERLSDDPDNELSVWLRQKHISLERFTLASSRTRMEPSDTHTLELYVRDQLLYAVLDGSPMFGTHIKLRGEPKPGMLGISVWDPERGRARVDIASVALRSQHPAIASWSSDGMHGPHVVNWIHNNSYHLTQLSPPWISFTPVGQVIRETWDTEIYDRLARIYHLNLVPRVNITEEEWLSRLPPSQLASQAADLNIAGVYVNLENLHNPTASRVASWVQAAAAALKEQGKDLLVKFPSSLERPATINSIMAIAPSMQVVAAPNSVLQATAQGRSLATVQLAQVPDADRDMDLPIYYELLALPDSPDDQTLQTRVVALEQEGQAAFLDSEYEQAISHWSEWQALEQSNPRPLMLIGDAYLRLNQHSAAIDFYDQSLELDPGQISLALRRVRILDQQGREDEAMASLNLYARLFPNNAQVLLAQAEWLHTRRRGTEARQLAERVLHIDPYNIDALTMLIRMADTPEERERFLMQIAEHGRLAESHYELGQAIWRHDILSIPEAHGIGELVERVFNETTDTRVRLLYQTLRARTELIQENVADGTLSENWWLAGATVAPVGERLGLSAESGRTEATVRLLGSERLRDSFIEATLQKWNGAFWMYAMRSERQLVRFGFENPDRLHLQIWRQGRMVVNETKAIDVLQQNARLRLEIRGSGMMGYLDGKPVFDAPVPLPPDLWLGWSGLGVFDARRGQAMATLDALSAGPLPVRVAMLPASPSPQDVDLILDAMREHARTITDLSPRWFTVRPDGEWVSHIGAEDRLFRLFSRYHRMRLMPVVEVLSGSDTPVRDIVEHARRNAVDGFILKFSAMPSDRWFEEMRKQIGLTRIDIMVMVTDTARDVANTRALGAAVDIFRGHGGVWPINLKAGSLLSDDFNKMLRELPVGESVVLTL